MNASFTYSLTLDDYISFEKIMIKQKHFGIMTYISTLILLAVGVFNYVGTKEPSLLILSVAYAAASILSVFAEKKLIPQRKAKKYTRLDNTYFSPRKVIISDSAVELTLESDGEDSIESIGVYPFNHLRQCLKARITLCFWRLLILTSYQRAQSLSSSLQRLKICLGQDLII